jgi:hypothetical protein
VLRKRNSQGYALRSEMPNAQGNTRQRKDVSTMTAHVDSKTSFTSGEADSSEEIRLDWTVSTSIETRRS